ncbi:hypothetical protein EV356DRAFT_334109 [Viridothelium virens]|uniref:Transcriptional regulatory protein DEP1 n=1 Tax=Viridothelium virens TaxID=1048519 RepID=A0A6A6HJP0_VIRVR|nr:hypothetical protein EV356DRAFT_334109 [Viridothelium virens]
MADQEANTDGPMPFNEPESHLASSAMIVDTQIVDQSDSRSSSLSDYDERYGENENGSAPEKSILPNDDADSEAETERLDITPHHASKLKGDIPTSDNENSTTPSKLQRTYNMVEGQDGDSTSPSILHEPITTGNGTIIQDENLEITPTLSRSDSSRLSQGAVAGRKRKRKSESGQSPGVDSEIVKPAEKRLNSAPQDGPSEMLKAEGGEQAEDELSEEGSKGPDNETSGEIAPEKEAPLQVSVEQEEEPAPPKKDVKARKGKRKSKRANDLEQDEDLAAQGETAAAAEQLPEAGEALSAEGEGEEADVAARNEEELQRKKAAMDALVGIEEHFASFRERLLDEKLNQVERELALLQQPNPTHPEYLAMMQCIDARHENQIQLEDRLLAYKLNTLEVQTIAERSQIHAQYFQKVRDIRDDVLERIGKELFRIQKERRQAHGDEPEYNYVYEADRPKQIIRQTMVNKEVSLLSGIKKYQGFPAAPKLKALQSAEADDDLRAMKLNSTPTPILSRHLNEPMPTEKHAAEEFFAQNPWANPQHPAHQQNTMPPQAVRPINAFTTPTSQRRAYDPHLPNGSGSTIAVPSDPPSSALAPGGNSHGPVIPEASAIQDAASRIPSFDGAGDSPLMYMKRNHEPGRRVPEESSEQWSAPRRASVATQGSPPATTNAKEKVAVSAGKVNTADPSMSAREASGPGAEALGFTPSAGVKTEDEVHGGGRLAFAMPSAHGQGQARQVGIAAGGFGR